MVGFVFGAWLLPEFYNTASPQYAMGIGYYPWFILTEMAWSVVMTWIYNKTNESAFVSGYLLHAFFNAWTMLLLTDWTLESTLMPIDISLFQMYTLIIGISAILLLIWTKGNLDYKKIEKAK